MRFLVTILSLLSITCSVAFAQEVPANSNASIVAETLKKVTGQLIRVTEYQDSLTIKNTCTATLTGRNTILTAAHCLDIKSNEKLYFNINGVTHSDLSAALAPLTTDGMIKAENMKAARKILKNIPFIKKAIVHPEFLPVRTTERRYEYYELDESNKATNVLKTLKPELGQADHDLASAGLNKKITTTDFLQVAEFADHEDSFVAGFIAGELKNPLEILNCKTGSSALEQYLADLEKQEVIDGLSSEEKDNLDAVKDLYREYNQTAILQSCDGLVKMGFSGGSNVVVRDGKVYLTGVSSIIVQKSTINRRPINASPKVISTRAEKAWDSKE